VPGHIHGQVIEFERITLHVVEFHVVQFEEGFD
jgi:hypothetical protein